MLNVDSIEEPFTYDKQDDYKPITTEIKVKDGKISYSFPAHSFTQIEVKVNR